MKGLYDKWAVWAPHPDCAALGPNVVRLDYARDAEGRLWRRVYRAIAGGYRSRMWNDVTRWHIADMYAWFPGADPATIQGARRQNTRARPPRKVDVYLIGDRLDIVPRPPYPFQPQERNS